MLADAWPLEAKVGVDPPEIDKNLGHNLPIQIFILSIDDIFPQKSVGSAGRYKR